jgi:hypothetical protein
MVFVCFGYNMCIENGKSKPFSTLLLFAWRFTNF